MRPGPASLTTESAAERAFVAPLPRSFYEQPTERVARRLLGTLVVRRSSAGFRLGRIVETEAYVAGDRANHAVLGPTMRNRAMFGPPGTLYVYRIHQVHCANAVAGGGEAVLLRSLEPLLGIVGEPRGPGRLCRELGIGREENGTSLIEGPLRIAPGAEGPRAIVQGKRVGIRHDVHRRLRFALEGSPWISSPRLPGPGGRSPESV
ncbi:MAG: DNA-3-methyladenine glycosylase [Thermoplasmata archaeon]|nr:DNA-3-methyladenine glycosylase [Thermoplasmata archaeon]